MAVKPEQKKVSRSGKTVSSVSSPRKGNVIARVVSYLRGEPAIRYRLLIPKGRSVGKVLYAVEFGIVTTTFTSRRDALTFKQLLLLSVESYQSDIVRREISDEGFYLQ